MLLVTVGFIFGLGSSILKLLHGLFLFLLSGLLRFSGLLRVLFSFTVTLFLFLVVAFVSRRPGTGSPGGREFGIGVTCLQ